MRHVGDCEKADKGTFRFGPIPLKNADGMLIEMLS
jgi:hypothetical protein